MATAYIFLYYIVINLVGYTIMHVDKQRAIQNKYRISENNLWSVALFGGAVGSTLGMNKFRHKTKHASFKFGLPLLAFIQVCLLIWFVVFELPYL